MRILLAKNKLGEGAIAGRLESWCEGCGRLFNRPRGGIVRKDEEPIRYALPYIGLGVVIVLSAIVPLAAWLRP